MSRRVRTGLFLAAAAGLGALLIWGYAGLPDFGHYRGPYGFVVDRLATPDRHMTNVVNATTYDIRGFDTMGEEFILFAAVMGVVLLLRGDEDDDEIVEPVRGDLLRSAGPLMVGGGTLVALWLISFGFVTPGGGFQGGVALASGLVLVFLAVGYRSWSAIGNEHVLDPFEGFGAGGYAVVGLVALAIGSPYLKNVLGPGQSGTIWSGGSAALVNWAAGIEVAAANLILFSSFLQHFFVEKAKSR